MAERIFVRKIHKTLWQWRHVTSHGEWQNDAFYTGDINLLREDTAGRAVWLYLPGADIITQTLDMVVKDRRMLTKLVPYEVEEFAIDPIENLAFAYGVLGESSVPVGYARLDGIKHAIDEIEALNADVQHVIPDYLGLARDAGDLSILLENDHVLVRSGDAVGFTIEKDLASRFFALHFEQELPSKIVLIAGGREELEELSNLLPESLDDVEDLEIEQREGGYWDAFALESKAFMDFRTGPLARQLPFLQWWNDWKIPAIGVAAAFIIAVGANWWELKHYKAEQRHIFAERDQLFRQVVKNGAISDPVRQLTKLLGTGEVAEPSRFMHMMSKVATPISASKDMSLKSVRYSQTKGELNLTIEATDFAMYETLRGKIEAIRGFKAEIKQASGQQAQIIVTEAKS